MIPSKIAPAALALLGSIATVGIVLLIALGHPAPEILSTLATVALSALAGFAIQPPAAVITTSPATTPTPAAPAQLAAVPDAPVALIASQDTPAAVSPPVPTLPAVA